MAGWGPMKNQQMPNLKGFEFDDDDLVMGMMLSVSQKPRIDLLQNCDLPSPMKVFLGSNN